MCLSNVYTQHPDSETKLLGKNIARIDVGHDGITLTDLLGRTHVVAGSIASVDLVENKVFINVS